MPQDKYYGIQQQYHAYSLPTSLFNMVVLLLYACAPSHSKCVWQTYTSFEGGGGCLGDGKRLNTCISSKIL